MRAHLTNSNTFSRYLRIMETECHFLSRETHKQLKQAVYQEAKDICADHQVIVPEEGELAEATRFPETADTLRDKVDTAEWTLENSTWDCKYIAKHLIVANQLVDSNSLSLPSIEGALIMGHICTSYTTFASYI